MTIPNTFTNGTLANANEVNTNFNWSTNFDLHHWVSAAVYTGIIAHSASAWSTVAEDGTMRYTADTGVTWASPAGTHGLGTETLLVPCEAAAARGFAVELNKGTGTADCAQTINSGATWNDDTNSPLTTATYDCSFPTATLLVLAGDDTGGTDHIVYTANPDAGPIVWTNATMDTANKIYCLDMYDGTTGYAVDSANNITKTTDGAVNWADTGHNLVNSSNGRMSIKCISATKCIIQVESKIELYDNASGSTNVLQVPASDASRGIVYSNGNIYVLTHNYSANAPDILSYSGDDGVTWSQRYLYWGNAVSTINYKRALDTTANDKLIFPLNNHIVQMDLS